jgi:hypothetical protein
VLASTTFACYLRVIPLFFKKRDWFYAAVAVLEIIVLMLAASGVLRSGH